MDRQTRFISLKKHNWYGRTFSQLKACDIAFCLEWIRQHDHLDRNAFEMACNRMWLDKGIQGNNRKKYLFMAQELISIANA